MNKTLILKYIHVHEHGYQRCGRAGGVPYNAIPNWYVVWPKVYHFDHSGHHRDLLCHHWHCSGTVYIIFYLKHICSVDRRISIRNFLGYSSVSRAIHWEWMMSLLTTHNLHCSLKPCINNFKTCDDDLNATSGVKSPDLSYFAVYRVARYSQLSGRPATIVNTNSTE